MLLLLESCAFVLPYFVFDEHATSKISRTFTSGIFNRRYQIRHIAASAEGLIPLRLVRHLGLLSW
jgi:hypothetical protein